MQASCERRRLTVHGTVQGVGFRPFVYGLATSEGLTGIVRNDGGAAVIEIQGEPERLARFIERLRAELPPPGRIERIDHELLPLAAGEGAFVIAESAAGARIAAALAPDGYVCQDCLAEMRDPADRRYRHPFITCTRCGPRYTITQALPYDRPNTTLARFALCAGCAREYGDPRDRRYHAQPVSCPACGPRAWLVLRGAEPRPPAARERDPAAPLDRARELLLGGAIVAVKGIGGFHLAVDARNSAAVARLRAAKQRPRKPLAVMARDLEVARGLVELDTEIEALLASHAAPIVLAPARRPNGLPPQIAPGLGDLGIFLPYSGVHHLLLDDDLPLVVLTSGNAPSEPITTDNAEALAMLPADAFLLHDRDIHVACDDSVVRAHRCERDGPSGVSGEVGFPPAAGAARDDRRRYVFVRRARGYVPASLPASFLPRRRVLALGAELKVTLATLHDGELVVGRHLGDLDNPAAEAAFRAEIERMLRFARLSPEAVVLDEHPDLYSAAVAPALVPGVPLVRVQHHHAHLAAVLVEHGVGADEEVAGIVLDGLGYAGDGTIWGGEILVGTYAQSRRIGHLRPVPQPGGDRAAHEPARMATSLLLDAGLGAAGVPGFDERFAAIASKRSVSPLTSSTGRLFDGVAAILGVAPDVQDYEGEAAARLEAAADPRASDAYPLPSEGGILDTRALVAAIVADRAPAAVRAARFHNALADGLATVALAAGREVVVLGGGSMVNRLLLRRLVETLTRGGARVLLPKALPPGDGGLAAGQAACAACRLERG